MKTLKIKKENIFGPLAVNKEDVISYTLEGNTEILNNGIMTAIGAEVSCSLQDANKYKTALTTLIGRLVQMDEFDHFKVEVEVNGETIVTGEPVGENFEFCVLKVKFDYEEN